MRALGATEMNRRVFLKNAGRGIITSFILPSKQTRAAPYLSESSNLPDTAKMNVLFIDVEDMTAAAAGYYGNQTRWCV